MLSYVLSGRSLAGGVDAKLISQSQCLLRLKRKNTVMIPMVFALNSNVADANDESLAMGVFTE